MFAVEIIVSIAVLKPSSASQAAAALSGFKIRQQ